MIQTVTLRYIVSIPKEDRTLLFFLLLFLLFFFLLLTGLGSPQPSRQGTSPCPMYVLPPASSAFLCSFGFGDPREKTAIWGSAAHHSSACPFSSYQLHRFLCLFGWLVGVLVWF
jgi:hypothetical protein